MLLYNVNNLNKLREEVRKFDDNYYGSVLSCGVNNRVNKYLNGYNLLSKLDNVLLIRFVYLFVNCISLDYIALLNSMS